jgi:hypothetical protein
MWRSGNSLSGHIQSQDQPAPVLNVSVISLNPVSAAAARNAHHLLKYSCGSVRKAHDKAVEDAGIEDHFRLYDLRHTFATRAVAGGVDLPTLSAMLGHTSIQMTMRYVHPAEEQKKIATGKLEAFRIAGIVQAIEKSRSLTTDPTTVN